MGRFIQGANGADIAGGAPGSISPSPINPFSGVFGTGRVDFIYNTATWTPPPGIKAVRVRVFGRGGNGNTIGNLHKGGGGGGFAMKVCAVTPGTGIAATVPTTETGTASFGAFCSATAGGDAGVLAGVGGTGVGGDINRRGGAGGDHSLANWVSGGGGVGSLIGDGGKGGGVAGAGESAASGGGGGCAHGDMGQSIRGGNGFSGMATQPTKVNTSPQALLNGGNPVATTSLPLDLIGTGPGSFGGPDSQFFGQDGFNGGGGGAWSSGGFPGGGAGGGAMAGTRKPGNAFLIIEY